MLERFICYTVCIAATNDRSDLHTIEMAVQGESRDLRFQDKVVIVTGGCKGIGRGCVDVFAENGGKVAVFDKNEEAAESLQSASQGRIFFIRCDMTSEDDIKRSIEAVVTKWGNIDCLINNAGWHPPAKEIDDFTSEEFKQLLDLNLVGYFLCCKYALPYLRKSKGNIINMGSVAKKGQSRASTYAATKGGVSAMTKTLAVDEAKHGVRVNEVSPGSIWTPLVEEWARNLAQPEVALESLRQQNLFKEFGDPREVALACLYLATDATHTTGVDLFVTAGMEIGFGNKFKQ